MYRYITSKLGSNRRCYSPNRILRAHFGSAFWEAHSISNPGQPSWGQPNSDIEEIPLPLQNRRTAVWLFQKNFPKKAPTGRTKKQTEGYLLTGGKIDMILATQLPGAHGSMKKPVVAPTSSCDATSLGRPSTSRMRVESGPVFISKSPLPPRTDQESPSTLCPLQSDLPPRPIPNPSGPRTAALPLLPCIIPLSSSLLFRGVSTPLSFQPQKLNIRPPPLFSKPNSPPDENRDLVRCELASNVQTLEVEMGMGGVWGWGEERVYKRRSSETKEYSPRSTHTF